MSDPDEAYKELVKRLQRVQVGMANEEEDAVLAAIAAIEAMAGEVERLKVMVETNKATAERAMTERDRLKAALEKARHELVTHNGLYATDIYPENREQLLQNGVNIEWQIDVSAVLETIDAALGGAS